MTIRYGGEELIPAVRRGRLLAASNQKQCVIRAPSPSTGASLADPLQGSTTPVCVALLLEITCMGKSIAASAAAWNAQVLVQWQGSFTSGGTNAADWLAITSSWAAPNGYALLRGPQAERKKQTVSSTQGSSLNAAWLARLSLLQFSRPCVRESPKCVSEYFNLNQIMPIVKNARRQLCAGVKQMGTQPVHDTSLRSTSWALPKWFDSVPLQIRSGTARNQFA